MRRGDVIAVADRSGDFAGKPRPAVIVQSDLFAAMGSVTICPLTSERPVDQERMPLLRLRIVPSDALPLAAESWVQVDKVTTIRRSRAGPVLGRLSREDLLRLDRALVVFLGIG
jgi:mRNA interferase MazF